MTDMVMRASQDQKRRTKMSEGLRLDAYLDTQDPPHWTIGYGRADTNPKPVRGLIDGKFYQGKPCRGLQITQAEADRLFDEDAEETERVISAAVDHHLTQNQFDALFDFVHHYGANNFLGSTLLKRINFNPNNLDAIIPQFTRWNINAGKRDKGIYMRSCRRACVYAGAPIPQILWEPKNFPWKVTADDEIDHNYTPDAFFLIELGMNKAKPYVFDPNKIEMPPRDSQEPAGKVEPVGGAHPAQDSEPASAATAGPLEGVGAQDDPSPPVAPAADDILDLDDPIELPKDARPDPAPIPAPHLPGSDGTPQTPDLAPGIEASQAPPASVESSRVGDGEKGAAPVTTRPPLTPPVRPPPLPSDPVPANVTDAKDMVLSRRFWGLVVTAIGTTNFMPRAVQEWASNEGNRELLTWVVVVALGFALYKFGQHKARRPLK